LPSSEVGRGGTIDERRSLRKQLSGPSKKLWLWCMGNYEKVGEKK